MSQHGFNDDVYLDQAISHHLSELLNNGEILESTVAGICRQVIGKGRSTLSDKQEFIFKIKVEKEFLQRECQNCGHQLTIDELGIDESGEPNDTCFSCQHDRRKRR